MNNEVEMQNVPSSASADSGIHAETKLIDYKAPDPSLQRKDQDEELEWPEQDDLQTRIDKIKSALGTRLASRTAVFTVGDLLAKAKSDGLSDKDYQHLVEQSGLHSISNADNYKRVAERGQLRRPTIREHLPVTVGALIDLVTWEPAELKACIDAGVMHPDATRGDLRRWLSEHRGKSSTNRGRRLVLEVYTQERDWTEEDTVAVEQALAHFGTRVHLVRPMTPHEKYLKAMSSWYKKVMGYARKLARARVRAVKKSKGKSWALHWDEVDIPADAGFDRIELVLDTVGLPDEHEGIRENALAKFDPPEPPKDVEAVDDFDELAKQIQAFKNRRKDAKQKWDRAWAQDQAKLGDAKKAAEQPTANL